MINLDSRMGDICLSLGEDESEEKKKVTDELVSKIIETIDKIKSVKDVDNHNLTYEDVIRSVFVLQTLAPFFLQEELLDIPFSMVLKCSLMMEDEAK
jgi:hypothetical protein